MNANNLTNWPYAYAVLLSWNPDIFLFHPIKKVKDRKTLLYRTMGIVQHDRVLNTKCTSVQEFKQVLVNI